MALTVFTGFEGWKVTTGIQTSWAYGSAACSAPGGATANAPIETTGARSGSNFFRCNPAATTKYMSWSGLGAGIDNASNTAELAVTFHVKAANLPNTAVTVPIFYVNCTTISDFGIYLVTAGVNSTSATIRATWGANSVDVGTINEGGDWVRISFSLTLNGAGTKSSNVIIDGGAVQVGPTTTGTGTFGQSDLLSLGAYTSSTYDMYFDDVAFFNAAADIDSLGDFRCFGGVPTADGTHSITAGYVTNKAGTNILNSTTDAYTNIDIPGFDATDTTDIRYAITGSETLGRVAFKMGAPPISSGTIHAVQILINAAPSAAVSRTITAHLWDGSSSAAVMPARTIAVARAGGYAVGGLRTTNPSAGAWDVNALEALEYRVWSASAIMYLYGVSYEVAYSPEVAAAGGETGQLARSRHWNSFQVRVKSGGTAGNLGVSAVGSA